MFPTFADFCAKQSDIYDKIRDQSMLVRQGGVQVDPVIDKQIGGLGIAFRHLTQVANAVAAISTQVAACTPAINYTPEKVHTTIINQANPGFRYSDSEHALVFGKVVEILSSLIPALDKDTVVAARITYTEPLLYNQASTLLPGQPNEAWLDLWKTLYEACAPLLSDAPLPWGCHITVNRFIAVRPPDQLTDFFALMDSQPKINVVSHPVGVDVAYLEVAESNVLRTVLHSFDLTN